MFLGKLVLLVGVQPVLYRHVVFQIVPVVLELRAVVIVEYHVKELADVVLGAVVERPGGGKQVQLLRRPVRVEFLRNSEKRRLVRAIVALELIDAAAKGKLRQLVVYRKYLLSGGVYLLLYLTHEIVHECALEVMLRFFDTLLGFLRLYIHEVGAVLPIERYRILSAVRHIEGNEPTEIKLPLLEIFKLSFLVGIRFVYRVLRINNAVVVPLEVLFVLRKSLALYIQVLYLIFAVNTLRVKLLPGDTVDFFTVLSVSGFTAADLFVYSLHPGIRGVKLLFCKLQGITERNIIITGHDGAARLLPLRDT